MQVADSNGIVHVSTGNDRTAFDDHSAAGVAGAGPGAVINGAGVVVVAIIITAHQLQAAGALNGQVLAIQIQGLVTLDSVGASQRQGGFPGQLDGGGNGPVVPVHLAGDGFLRRQGGHLAVYPAEQGFQLLHAVDLRLLGLAQGFKSGVRRYQRVQVAFGHIPHVRQGIDHGLHRRHGLILPGGSSLLGGDLRGLGCLGRLRFPFRRLRFLFRRLRFLFRRLRGGVRLLTGVGSPHHLHSLGGIRRLLRPGRGGQHPDTQCQGQNQTDDPFLHGSFSFCDKNFQPSPGGRCPPRRADEGQAPLRKGSCQP